MPEQVVRFEEQGAIGTITLDRPPANSYDIEFMRQLDAAIMAADSSSSTRAVILRSASVRFFSAGADIKAFGANTAADNMRMIRTAHAALDKMSASLKIFVAQINSHALGGGLEMALACDFRFAAAGSYKLGLPEVTLGLLPGNGGTQRLPRLIGPNKALEMMVTGRTLGPDEALSMGLVNRVVAAEALAAETQGFAEKLASGPTLAIGAIKRAVYDGCHVVPQAGLALERELMSPLFDSLDAQEGFAAFAEKRPPVYKGR